MRKNVFIFIFIAACILSVCPAEAQYCVEGSVFYDDGSPATGVAVSDGFRSTLTDIRGNYTLATCPDTRYIYFSYPSDAVICRNQNGLPDFYKSYDPRISRYDFCLKRGKEERQFALFAMADPQAHSQGVRGQHKLQVERFRDESVPAVNSHCESLDIPCYGVMLGDIVYSEDDRNSTVDMPLMRDYMKPLIFPVFQVMGNHDYSFCNQDIELVPDERGSTLNLLEERSFTDYFGPVNYSFNRADAHIVCMKDIMFEDGRDATKYHGGISDSQYLWLKEDLASVPDDKLLIFCVHIPLTDFCTEEGTNGPEISALLKRFRNVHILSGHMHYMKNITPEESPIGMYEHIHAALCGQWWWSNLNGDGTPNGYGVYVVSGSRLSDQYYMGVNEGMNERSFQMRLYRGACLTGGEYEHFLWNESSDMLIANVFNADAQWILKVYEDGVFTGTMTRVPFNNAKVPYEEGKITLTPEGSSKDWWTIGYHTGILGWSHVMGGRYQCNGFHLFSYKMKNPSACVKVVALDQYGNQYECSTITGGTEYPSYIERP